LLGQALLELNRVAEAEQELQVAVAQSPRNLVAHESLAKLYRHHLNRPDEAFAHEGRARSIRNELADRQRLQAEVPNEETVTAATGIATSANNAITREVPPAFAASVDPRQTIVIVSGLPRSGTSLMMQLLAAAGRETLSDAKRIPDADNPLGYFEFEKTLTLANDASWIPEARGKVVKIVAQLLPHLPRNEHYHVIFMDRNLNEVIASQKAMLARQGRRGAELDEQKLAETYRTQLQRVQRQIAKRPEMRTLSVNYGELIADPTASVALLAQFLGEPFDGPASVTAVHPELRRQKHGPA
jgi:tetratricopeptide (TPR) repeat protein